MVRLHSIPLISWLVIIMKTARQFVDAGVEFLYEEGSLCCVAPDECKDDLVAEVRRRVALIAPQLPKDGVVPIIKIAAFEEKRWGACMTCGDQIAHFAGGMCPLCILSLRKALQESGRFDPKPVPVALVAPVIPAMSPPASRPKVSLHKCHAFGCKVSVPERYLMCGPHWKMVSSELQARVWDTYVEGQEIRKDPTPEYIQAQIAAVRWVAKKEGKMPVEKERALLTEAAVPTVAAPESIAVPTPVDEYIVYIEAFSEKNRSAYCVLITRGENSFDTSELLSGNSSVDEAYCEGFVKALELITDKQAPVAICVASSLWNLAAEMPAWPKESAASTKARAVWKQTKLVRKQHATRIFASSEGAGTAIMRARQLAYLEVNPGGIWAPKDLPADG